MKTLLLTHGTRGDVQPFLALARALEAAGHTAVVAGPAAAAPLAADHGVTYRPVDDGPNTLMGDPELSVVMDTGLRGVRGAVQAATLVRRIKPLMRQVYADMAEAADDGADLVVHIPGMPGHHIAERLGVPSVPVALQPSWVPTSAFPAPGVPWPAWIPPVFNRASYRLVAMALRGQYSVADELRGRLGLDRRRHRHDPLRQADGGHSTLLQAFSRHLLPAGADYPPNVHTTGFWFPPAQEWSPPPELAAFLDAGEPPVFIGFSSLPSADPGRTGHLMADVVRAAGARAVIATGWGGIGAEAPLGNGVHVIDQAPHPWLFPRCAAVVHHGGGGTTGAALAAGRPQVVCPFWGDQPFWAQRAHAAGVATAPQRGQRLTARTLAAAITQATTDPVLIDTARTLGERARVEDGVHYAVEALERIGAPEPRP
ncbi:sterol 3beta-glucosyltransferase [Murinocardiopsis flavida]|uniref:Sterol 3beta-glucosyltransferase n=1 Tax=Murinocardiopsis flavida TaxID=645275 RepID=A0A2P8DMI8_9ACTN|nr:glycosyltransferase [Murinocardiopsis flavida]PSK98433.1 sterol 3beta-glucosyltransferase [Murinocardiopsis flavida]